MDVIGKRGGQGILCRSQRRGRVLVKVLTDLGIHTLRVRIFDRVAKGFYTAACLRSKYGEECVVGLAFPDGPIFRRYVQDVGAGGGSLKPDFYWVKTSGAVTEEQA